MDTEDKLRKQTIDIKTSEAIEAMAILSHLRQIFNTATKVDSKGQIHPPRPADMDQVELLRCSASIRTLFFDVNSPLHGFLKRHNLTIEIEAIETDLNLLLLSIFTKEDLHISDLFMLALFEKKTNERFDLEENKQVMYLFKERNGFEDIMKNTDLWMPNKEQQEEINSAIGINSTNFTPSQFINIKRRKINLTDWGKVRIGYLKNIPIDRKSLIEYVANWLGGVHYNSKHTSKNQDDKNKFHILKRAYDWDNQSFMHAGFVMTALACIEILNTPNIMNMYFELERFQKERIDKLANGDKLK